MDSFQKLDPFYRYNLIVSILNKHINDEKGCHQMINYNQREIWSIHTYYKNREYENKEYNWRW